MSYQVFKVIHTVKSVNDAFMNNLSPTNKTMENRAQDLAQTFRWTYRRGFDRVHNKRGTLLFHILPFYSRLFSVPSQDKSRDARLRNAATRFWNWLTK